jgi:hypothetical protein
MYKHIPTTRTLSQTLLFFFCRVQSTNTDSHSTTDQRVLTRIRAAYFDKVLTDQHQPPSLSGTIPRRDVPIDNALHHSYESYRLFLLRSCVKSIPRLVSNMLFPTGFDDCMFFCTHAFDSNARTSVTSPYRFF